MLQITKEKRDKIIKWVMECFDSSRAWRKSTGVIDAAKEAYRMYRGIPYPKDYEFQSNYWKPMTYRAVETILPRLVKGLFPSDEPFRYIATDENDDSQERMNNLSKTVRWKLYYETDFMTRNIYALKNACVFGTVVMYFPYTYKRRFIRINGKYKKITMVDAPKLQYKPIWDVYPQPNMVMNEADWTIIREIITDNELMARAGRKGGNYIKTECDKVMGDTEKGTAMPSGATHHIDELKALLKAGMSSNQNSHKIELLHYHGLYDLDIDSKHPEQTQVEAVITIANRKYLVAAGANSLNCQERPIESNICIPDCFGIYGIPVPQVGRDVNLEANDLMNMRLDNYNYVINKSVKVKRNTDIAEKMGDGDILVYPGSSFPVDDMDDIQEMRFSSMDSSAFVEQQGIDSEFDSVNGILDYNSSRPLGVQRTAKGVDSIMRESNARFDMMLNVMQPAYRSMFHKMGKMIQQYVDPTTILLHRPSELMAMSPAAMMNPKNPIKKKITREDMAGDFYTILSASSQRGDKGYMVALMQSLYPMWANDPNINIKEFDKQMAEAAEFYNLDILLNKVPVAIPPGTAMPFQGVVPGAGGSLPETAANGTAAGNAMAGLAREAGAQGADKMGSGPKAELSAILNDVAKI